MFRILLDAGHGEGRAHNRGGLLFNEGDNNYKYSLVLKRELEKIPGAKVDLVRTSIGQDPSVSARAAKGNGYDLFLSLHSNAASGGVRGTEIFDSVERPNKALAQKLVNAISKAFGHSNRGVKYKKSTAGTNWYGVLRNNRAKSSMIIEHGFHTNTQDSVYFRDNHKALAKATADVIRSHYRLANPKSVESTDLTVGSRGKEVVKLQKNLITLGYDVGAVGANGAFGELTKKAIEEFQSTQKNLRRDGVGNKETLARINKAIADKPKPTGKLYRVQVGAYTDKKNADRLAAELKAKGYQAIIKTE